MMPIAEAASRARHAVHRRTAGELKSRPPDNYSNIFLFRGIAGRSLELEQRSYRLRSTRAPLVTEACRESKDVRIATFVACVDQVQVAENAERDKGYR
jgi:hypothetical protein